MALFAFTDGFDFLLKPGNTDHGVTLYVIILKVSSCTAVLEILFGVGL